MGYSASEIRKLVNRCLEEGIRLLNIYVVYESPKLCFLVEYVTESGDKVVNAFPRDVNVGGIMGKVGGLRQIKVGRDFWIRCREDCILIYNVLSGNGCRWGVYKASLNKSISYTKLRLRMVSSGLIPKGWLRKYLDGPPRIRLLLEMSYNPVDVLNLLRWLPRPHRVGKRLLGGLVESGYDGGMDLLFYPSSPCNLDPDLHQLYVHYNNPHFYRASQDGLVDRYVIGLSEGSGSGVVGICLVGVEPATGSYIDLDGYGLTVCRVSI